ncbi:MAG: aldehyde ferredoxin oxidoreductase [Candidatus Cloacimonetes bacterium HGW-Cloacimonetes-1]|nr:MAG: aldehyde ferredoxin oxidoreductase [Candidatus Cloacimonetes bacterium HGW-Cloacimonetes-1]
MENTLRVLFVDVSTGYYKIERFPVGAFYGPVDLGLHLSGKYNSLNIGIGLLAGSIFPGSNRLVFTGFSPSWGGFYVSSMGGAGLIFDNLGISLLAIIGKSAYPSMLMLNRNHGEEIEVELKPVHTTEVWSKNGIYSMMDHTYETYGHRYETSPRILAVGPAAKYSDIGSIVSAPIINKKITKVDTWAGRGGMGSKLFKQHGICSVIYGGTFIDEDFRDHKVADEWFEARYQQKVIAKDIEATTKYRFDPKFDTGGTFGVNYSTNADSLIAFNYRSLSWPVEQRRSFHEQHIKNHYLKQFNEETIRTKSFHTCGEPCVAVCKKMRGEFKKDYEPYQTMGPLSGIFDQRAAELLNHKADMLGFDAISMGGFIAWIFDCLDSGLLKPGDVGLDRLPKFDPDSFDTVSDSMYNAELGCELLNIVVSGSKLIDLSEGARKYARHLARKHGQEIVDKFVFNSFARKGWMVPNQYWTPGVLSPMPTMGRYYMYYGPDYFSPRYLGKVNADRMKTELLLDNMGICRFHRAWAEEMLPEIIQSIYGLGDDLLLKNHITARRINCRNASVFWESKANIDFIHSYLKRQHDELRKTDADLMYWLSRFKENSREAAFDYWYEIRKGIDESLGEKQ